MLRSLTCFLAVFVLCGSVLAAEAHGDTITAASCSQADVQAAIDEAGDGDVVLVPAGTATWTTAAENRPAVVFSKKGAEKGITLRGAGIGKTVITDATGAQCFQVVIKSSESGIWSGVKDKRFRITGFTFAGAGDNAVISVGGANWRIDNCRFENSGRSLTAGGSGVIDHCIFDKTGNGQCIYVSGGGYGGGSNGDGSWSSPLTLGTGDAVYIEDCTFNYYADSPNAVLDGCSGARVVFRHNRVNNGFLASHGTESGGRQRSIRSYEIYNNTLTMDLHEWFTAVFLRGGTGVIFNNTLTGRYSNFVIAANYRTWKAFAPWGMCDGTSPYDGNQASDSGKHTGPADDSTLISDGKSWTVGEWVGYAVRNTTDGSSGIIEANDADTILVMLSGGTDNDWDSGDSFLITNGYPAIDQIGRSTGLPLSNWDPPLPQAWPQQELEPLCEWGNTLNGADADIVTHWGERTDLHVKEGRDYCNDTKWAGYTPYTYPHPLVQEE
ncbi:MAG: hypothetical protein KAX44_00995 [Candidatus Brocadiae bacterium]|nr:hypothetical protein [Candidatus Brocadiia bacterium]